MRTSHIDRKTSMWRRKRLDEVYQTARSCVKPAAHGLWADSCFGSQTVSSLAMLGCAFGVTALLQGGSQFRVRLDHFGIDL